MHDVRAVDKSISHFDEGGPPIKAYLVHNMLANFRLKRDPAFLLWVVAKIVHSFGVVEQLLHIRSLPFFYIMRF